jgi:hypothetical protein
MDREEAYDQSGRALALSAMCNMVFAGENGNVVGVALADLMSTYLRSHRIPGDPKGEREMREAMLVSWTDTVRDLVLLYDKSLGGTQ